MKQDNDKNILKHILLMVQYLFQLKPIKIVHFLIIKLIT